MSVRLEPILEATRQRVERCASSETEPRGSRGRIELGREGRPFREALSRPGTSVIAEHKRRSPSAGTLREGVSVQEMTIAYERGGAAALSILTEEEHFGGSLEDMREAIAVTDLPVLRKDFTIDRYQLLEAKATGADAVLLVVGALSPEQLADLHAEARQLDLDALVEVHDHRELDAALELDADVVGINNRDLTDFSVDVRRTFDLPRRRAGREDRGLRVGDLRARADRGARVDRHRRRARGGDADARGGPGGGGAGAGADRGADAGLRAG